MSRRHRLKGRRALQLTAAIVGTLAFLPGDAAGRQDPPAGQPQFFPPDSVFMDTPTQVFAEPITPRGAFLRALAVPGWGHVATRTYGRAGFYVAAQSGALWMLGTAIRRRSDAADFLVAERNEVRARLARMGVSDPDSIAVALAADPAVQSWEALKEARGQQVEDWAAMSIFLVLLGAADAYVSAHLMDFPEPLAIRAVPAGADGVELTLTVPLGGNPPRRTRR